MTIHDTPKRSETMPKRGEENVSTMDYFSGATPEKYSGRPKCRGGRRISFKGPALVARFGFPDHFAFDDSSPGRPFTQLPA